MRYLKNNRGVTLVEILITLVIGTMILGLVFLVPQLFQQQNDYNYSFNSAKNQVLLVTNSILERVEKAEKVDILIDDSTNNITLSLEGTEVDAEFFIFKPVAEKEDYVFEVYHEVFDSKSNKKNNLGTVGFNKEYPVEEESLEEEQLVEIETTFFILTFWVPYTQSNGVEEKFVVTQGFHTSVIN